MPTDQDRLQHLVEVWHRSAHDVIALLRSLEDQEWQLPTDLPGWDVRAVAAHLAHLESELAGNPQPPKVEVAPAAHVRSPLAEFTEAGVAARASWSTAEIVGELESSVEKRYADLTDQPPTDGSALGPGFAGLIGWSWTTLLTNRPLDMWMHEQDIRRAVGRPGGLDTAGATHCAGVFAKSLPFVLGKKVGAPAGTSVVLDVTGAQPQLLAAEVGADGRGAAVGALPADPTARITLDFEAWMVLAGGRRAPAEVDVEVTGDRGLGQQVLEHLAVTP